MPSQTASGKRFEYAIADVFADYLNAPLDGVAHLSAKSAFDSLKQIERIERTMAARDAVNFVIKNDRRLKIGNVSAIQMQKDNVAIDGDVRDIVIKMHYGEDVGISAKNRNRAIRNSRLSPRIDFGEKWFGLPCSSNYFGTSSPFSNFYLHLSVKGRYGEI